MYFHILALTVIDFEKIHMEMVFYLIYLFIFIYFGNFCLFYFNHLWRICRYTRVWKVPARNCSSVYLFPEISSFSSPLITAVHASSQRSIGTAEDQHWHFHPLPGVHGPVCSSVAPLPASTPALFNVGLLVQEEQEEKLVAAAGGRTNHGRQHWADSRPFEACSQRTGNTELSHNLIW